MILNYWRNLHGKIMCWQLVKPGLDKLCKIDFNLQEQLFEKQLVISKITGKPVIIHCVKAYREIINYRKKYPDQPWIVHRFNASEELSEELYQKGFLFFLW